MGSRSVPAPSVAMTGAVAPPARSRPRCVVGALKVAGLVLGMAIGLLAAPAPADAGRVPVARSASAEVSWLCHPDRAADDCRGSLVTTVQRADGTSRVVRPRRVPRPAVDCFYVYPTASQQPTPNAQPRREASVAAVARQQASRFSRLCRVFAPLYRQRTLVALSAEGVFTEEQRASFARLAYGDVLRAWRAFLEQRRPGWGFVLIGHSQGSRLLRKLVREEIDPVPALRRDLVVAVLPGADVLVRRGSDRGGDFRRIPLCASRHQWGCALAWSTFGQTPPDDSRFGRPPLADGPSAGLDLPVGRRYEVACTNPASLAENRRAPVRSLLRSEPFPGLLGLLLLQTFTGPPPRASTPWLVPAERYTARCETSNGARVLRIRPIGDARTLRPSPNDTWGLHLVDVNIVLGDVMSIVASQIRAFTRHR